MDSSGMFHVPYKGAHCKLMSSMSLMVDKDDSSKEKEMTR